MSTALSFADERTHGERRALEERDAAEARVDMLAATNARRHAAIEAAVRQLGELAAEFAEDTRARAQLCEVILRLKVANRTRETDAPDDSGGKD
jgi:hypothetical protein